MTALFCNFGVKTYAGYGGFPLPAGAATLSGPGAADWMISAAHTLVPSGTLGTAKTFIVGAGGSYNLTIVETGDTIAINMLGATAHAASSAEIQNLLFQSSTATTSYMKRGDDLLCRDGEYAALRPTCPLNGWDLPAGVNASAYLVVRAENLDYMTNGVGPRGVRVMGLSAEAKYATGKAVVEWWLQIDGFMIQGVRGANKITAGAINITLGKVPYNRIKFTRLRVFGGGQLNPSDNSGYTSGIVIPGNNIVIEDCLVHDVSDGLSLAVGTGLEVRRTAVIRASDDSYKFSASVGHIFEDCWSLYKLVRGTAEHPDHFQQSNLALPVGNSAGFINRRLVLVGGTESEDGQGDFQSKPPITAGVPAVQTNALVENLLVVCAPTNSISMSMIDNSVVRRSTSLRDNASVSRANILLLGCVNTVVHDCLGEFIQPLNATYADQRQTPAPTRAGSGNTSYNNTLLDTGLSALPTSTVRAALATILNAPTFGSANQPMAVDVMPTWDQVHAFHTRISAAFAPKVLDVASGGLRNPDGTYQGAFFPDGSWNDGTVYGQSGATNYTQTTASGVLQGAPLVVTYQLNAASTSDVKITPAASGVAGSFTPPTVVIPAGQTVGSTSFVATAAGTLVLSATNSGALANPPSSSTTVTVASATPPSAILSLAVVATTVAGYAPVIVTLTLDHATLYPITIALASSSVGAFGSQPLVMPGGVSTISFLYFPRALGTHSLSASSTGLTAPAPLVLTVTSAVPNRAELAALGIK